MVRNRKVILHSTLKVKLHIIVFIFSAFPPAEGGEVKQFDGHW